jgi:hypothetical protein
MNDPQQKKQAQIARTKPVIRIASMLLVSILAPQKQTSMTRLNSIEINAFVLTTRSDQPDFGAIQARFTYETAQSYPTEMRVRFPSPAHSPMKKRLKKRPCRLKLERKVRKHPRIYALVRQCHEQGIWALR